MPVFRKRSASDYIISADVRGKKELGMAVTRTSAKFETSGIAPKLQTLQNSALLRTSLRPCPIIKALDVLSRISKVLDAQARSPRCLHHPMPNLKMFSRCVARAASVSAIWFTLFVCSDYDTDIGSVARSRTHCSRPIVCCAQHPT